MPSAAPVDPDENELLDVNEFQLGPPNNGTPGIVTESVEDAIRKGRLAYEGLLLKPGAEFIRPAFENAADFALGAQGYYEISDYSGLSGMTLPWSAAGTNAWENQERQGTMCSGLVDWAFDQAGITITDAFYPASLRNDAAHIVFESVKEEGRRLGEQRVARQAPPDAVHPAGDRLRPLGHRRDLRGRLGVQPERGRGDAVHARGADAGPRGPLGGAVPRGLVIRPRAASSRSGGTQEAAAAESLQVRTSWFSAEPPVVAENPAHDAPNASRFTATVLSR